MGRPRRTPTLVISAVVALVAGVLVLSTQREDTERQDVSGTEAAALQDGQDPAPDAGGSDLVAHRLTGPPRTVLKDRAGAQVAVFTDGARTVVLTGPKRTFEEPEATQAKVTTSAWVRLTPQPWQAGDERAAWFTAWFPTARQDTGPDVLAVATQYVVGAPNESDGGGVRFRGDASFGPVKASGSGRQEQSDFYDYLGVPWAFPGGHAEQPDRTRYGSVDCSGYVRLVYGYRMGVPLLATNGPGPGLPRRAYAISEHGPGVALVPNRRSRATAYSLLQPGDLVFFEVEGGDDELDHAGIYLGPDDRGRHRFISSRERINGPTLGDVGGTSLLDDSGHYSRSWRSARRL